VAHPPHEDRFRDLLAVNPSEAPELSHPVQSLASSSPTELPASPREIGRISSRETLAFAVHHRGAGDNEPCVQVSIRRSANDTMDRDRSHRPRTRRDDYGFRRAPVDTIGSTCDPGNVFAERVRLVVAGEQADRDGALRRPEDVDHRHAAADAGSDRARAPKRKALERCLPGHEVARPDPGRDLRSSPRPLRPRPPLAQLRLTTPQRARAPCADSSRAHAREFSLDSC
jgi:hypothetical protein